jgi:hypothetical protein
VIATFILMLACISTEAESYAEKNGWIEVKPPRPDLQCWRVQGGPQTVCANSLNSTYGAFNGTN